MPSSPITQAVAAVLRAAAPLRTVMLAAYKAPLPSRAAGGGIRGRGYPDREATAVVRLLGYEDDEPPSANVGPNGSLWVLLLARSGNCCKNITTAKAHSAAVIGPETTGELLQKCHDS
jgi:hypothetical protein